MLSHLRFHRRAPSNPTSPLPEHAPAWDAAAQREQPPPPRDVSPRPGARPRSPNASQLPPTLPPITRVASTGSDHFFTPLDHAPPLPQEAHQPPARAGYDEENKAGFIGGVALQNYRKAAQAPPRLDTGATMAGQLPENQLSRAKPAPPPINTGVSPRPPVQGNKQTKASWFSTPTDLQGPGGNSKRPAAPRVTNDPAHVPASEPQKGRKGLPFLKNPMSSLLMRRKAAQTAVENQPPAPSYDPRIKGTRVHDFSAPRPKKTVSGDAVSMTKQETPPTAARTADSGEVSTALFGDGSAASPVEPAQDAINVPKHGENGDAQLGPKGRRLSSSTALPRRSPSLVPPNDASSLRTSSSAVSRKTQIASLPPASASVRTIASRQLSKADSVASAVPRHMKSTSSRFSFDMIGAAEQERLLEERHRQREQEKKTSDDPADARFDDFDDDFDYDAMMDDDGLEERIPGVNADYEYEEDLDADLDPDNDQENFAGFVFQRSGPASSLATPHTPGMLTTPRDATGNVIGFAMTKDTTPTSHSPMFPGALSRPTQDESSALGFHAPEPNTDAAEKPVFRPSPPTTSQQRQLRSENDDIYFDDGLADELDFEHDGTVFDESIFDNHDTDRYGRPIPGAFAQAKEAMQAAQQPQPSKRDSDMTSSTSGQSGVAQSTGQTSLSVGPQQPPGQQETEEASCQQVLESSAEIPGQDLAYQAALAEAAQLAAASGKFARSSSPEVLAVLDTPQDDLADYEDDEPNGYVDDYADDDFENNFDDFDFDDEAIIAEANASALANDSDGFYGQEFGFYSAPISHQPHNTHHQPSTTTTSSGVLTTENLFQYANGGFFGPASADINRSASGRVVREPNLTPITERSEYSNRNSVMSFTLPPAIGSGGSGGERNSASFSPGLAQLALLPADDAGDGMSLSALMKLRSRAWGGSQASLVSSREGSPRSERALPLPGLPPMPMPMPLDAGGSPYGTVPAHLAGHVRVNSGLSLWSCSEAAEEGGSSSGNGRGSGAGSPAMMGVPLPPQQTGVLPPRPGSAGAVVNGSTGNGTNGVGGVISPLPQRPHSLFLPPPPVSSSQAPLPVPSPGSQQMMGLGGSACSPVLEGEEAEPESAVAAADGFALAPALPLRARSPTMQSLDGGGETSTVSAHRPGMMGHRRKVSADSISYRKDEEGDGSRWVLERRRTAESGEVEVLGREVVDGGRI